jgi:beta-galactosidase
LYEFKKLAQAVAVIRKEGATFAITVRSKQDFRDLSYLTADWTLSADGVVLKTGKLDLSGINPGQSKDFDLSDLNTVIKAFDGERLSLHVSFQLAEAEGLLPAGHEMGWEHLVLSERPLRLSESVASVLVPVEQSDVIELGAAGVHASVSRTNGQLVSLGATDNVLAHPLQFTWWRAATDNDGVKLWDGQEHKPLMKWKAAGLHESEQTLTAQQVLADGTVESIFKISTPVHAEAGVFTQRVRLTGAGLVVENELACLVDLPDLPRIGTQFALVAGYEQVDYSGYGPYENYCDRDAGVWQDHFTTTVSDMHVPYIMPQECGSRSATRWCAFRNQQSGATLRIEALEERFEFKASHYTDSDWFAATHTHEIAPRPETYISIDHRQRGVGTHSCGPDTLEKYRIQPGIFKWALLVSLA